MEEDDPGEAWAAVGAASTKSPLSLGSPDTEASVLAPRALDEGQGWHRNGKATEKAGPPRILNLQPASSLIHRLSESRLCGSRKDLTSPPEKGHPDREIL